MDTKPVSILIIDGDSASRNYLSTMLRKSGYEVVTASLGREGLISAWKDQPCHVNCDCGRFLELGNSVFMQYQKQADGSFTELPQKNVDFGGGPFFCVIVAGDTIFAGSDNKVKAFSPSLLFTATFN